MSSALILDFDTIFAFFKAHTLPKMTFRDSKTVRFYVKTNMPIIEPKELTFLTNSDTMHFDFCNFWHFFKAVIY